MKIIKAEERIYAIQFMNYADSTRTKVHSEEDDTMLELPSTGRLLVRECDLPKYKKYGGGYRFMTYLGVMNCLE